MDNLQLIRQLLDNIRGNLEAIDKLMPQNVTLSISNINEKPVECESEPVIEVPRITLGALASSLSVDQLGPMPDINDQEWPDAVPDFLIVHETDPSALRLKAMQVQGGIGVAPTGINVLDYGSGIGHIADQYAKTTVTYAYDIDKKAAIYNNASKEYRPVKAEQWEGFCNDNSGKLDLIILYDVLDHVVGGTAIDVLSKMSKLLSPNGKIFLRCHPWTSRTGGHLYTQHNKAFLHLALTPEEMLTLGLNCEPNIKTNKPLAMYEHIINKVGLKTIKKQVHTNAVESYIADNILPRIIKTTWSGKITEEKAIKIMATSNVDYLLTI